MDTLATLIKLSKHELEEKRRALARIEEEREKLRIKKEALIKEEAYEKKVAAENLDAKRFYLQFLKRHHERLEKLEQVINATDKKIIEAQEDIRIAFGELKKYQILLEQKKKKEAELLLQAETKMLDELGIDNHQRFQNQIKKPK